MNSEMIRCGTLFLSPHVRCMRLGVYVELRAVGQNDWFGCLHSWKFVDVKQPINVRTCVVC